MATQVATLPVLPFDQIEAMIETVNKFLPIANNFLPAQVTQFEALLPVIELDLKILSALQANTDPSQANAIAAAQMRAMADKLAPPA